MSPSSTASPPAAPWRQLLRDRPPLAAQLPGAARRLDLRGPGELHDLRRRRATTSPCSSPTPGSPGAPTWAACRTPASAAPPAATTSSATTRSCTSPRSPATRRRCARVVPQARLDADLRRDSLPAFSWLSPDLCADAHDCDLASADRSSPPWCRGSPAASAPTACSSITFDEGKSDAGCCGAPGGGRVFTVLVGPDVRRGARLRADYDHYSLLAGIEDAFGLPRLRHARGARPLPLPGSHPLRVLLPTGAKLTAQAAQASIFGNSAGMRSTCWPPGREPSSASSRPSSPSAVEQRLAARGR